MNGARMFLLLMLGLIVLDVLGNVLLAWSSWRNTLSATAWKNRGHRFFGWCHRFIDWLPIFGAGHCQRQFDTEQQFGSVWAAWHHDFKKA